MMLPLVWTSFLVLILHAAADEVATCLPCVQKVGCLYCFQTLECVEGDESGPLDASYSCSEWATADPAQADASVVVIPKGRYAPLQHMSMCRSMSILFIVLVIDNFDASTGQ